MLDPDLQHLRLTDRNVRPAPDLEGAGNNRCDVGRSAFAAVGLIYLVVRHLLGWARLSRCDAVAEDVQILILRHQLAVAQRRAPARELQRKLTWRTGRGWLCRPGWYRAMS